MPSRVTLLAAAAAVLTASTAACGTAQTYQVLDLQRSGNDDQSPTFNITGAWQLHYSYDCTQKGDTGGLVIQVVNQSDDTLIAENPDVIDAHAAAGKETSTDAIVTFHATTGALYLQVQSGCGWRIQVRETQ